MKRMLLAILAFGLIPFSPASADPKYPVHPADAGYVNDFANIIDDTQQAILERDLRAFEKKTHAEIAVVTVTSLDGYTVAEYAHGLFRSWGLGKKGANNGVLLLVAPTERKVRIEVGYRLEPILTDAKSGDIIRIDMHDAVHPNDFGGRTIKGARAIMRELTPGLAVEGQQIMSNATPKNIGSGGAWLWLVALLAGLGGVGWWIIARARRVREANRADSYVRGQQTWQPPVASDDYTEPGDFRHTVSASSGGRRSRSEIPIRTRDTRVTPIVTPTPPPARERDSSDDDTPFRRSGFGSSDDNNGSLFGGGSDNDADSGVSFGGGDSGGGGADGDL